MAGLLIDLSLMNSVHVDAAARTARVEAGALLSDFDKKAQAFGLATPLGVNSTTGVAGLTLGGGFGWTTRKFGLTVDNLLSADVVTADAKLVRTSATEHPDLFWALRGGGGNFGVVTSFEFKLHPLGPEVLSGLVVHPFEDAGLFVDRIPPHRQGSTRRAHDVGRHAQSAATPVFANRMARQGGLHLCGLLQRRHAGRRERRQSSARLSANRLST